MSEFLPVETKADLATLDDEDIVNGYRAALDGAPCPGSDRSRGYWHGWRNGCVDAGRCAPDAAQQKLALEYARDKAKAVRTYEAP